ncbi:hypothetical protein FBQ97_00175 [Acidobacteria bacterium ACD]|nr:hypothetical protein [Acidobacteria bacterium ACD]
MPTVGEAVILIPGFMGSRLVRPEDGQTVWLDPEWNLLHLAEAIDLLRLRSPDDRRLVPGGVLERVPLGAFSPQVYTPLLEFLTTGEKGIGYPASSIHTFAFDWRRSIEEAAYALDSKIGRWASGYRSDRPFVVLAHSYGGLVAAHALFTGNHAAARVALLVTFGVPFGGLLKTLASLQQADEIDDLPFGPSRLAELLGDWPGSYDLMPFRETTGLIFDSRKRPRSASSAGFLADGFRADLATESAQRLRRHSVPLPEDIEGKVPPLGPRPLPVPVRAIVGSGVETAVGVRVSPSGRYQIVKGFEGDGTTPVRGALDFATAHPGDRVVYPVPYGHHVGLVKHPQAFRYLRTELRHGTRERFVVVATPRSRLLPAGSPNELTIEVRDGAGEGLIGSFPPRVSFSAPVKWTEAASEVEATARQYIRFAMPAQPVRVTVTIPGLPPNVQPEPVLVVPAV